MGQGNPGSHGYKLHANALAQEGSGAGLGSGLVVDVGIVVDEVWRAARITRCAVMHIAAR